MRKNKQNEGVKLSHGSKTSIHIPLLTIKTPDNRAAQPVDELQIQYNHVRYYDCETAWPPIYSYIHLADAFI